MSRTVLTERQRYLLTLCKRKAIAVKGEDAKTCAMLVTKGLLKRGERHSSLVQGKVEQAETFKITTAGVRALKGETWHPESDKAKERRQWAAETTARKSTCARCKSALGVHGHHKKYASGGGSFDASNRIDLCELCHDWAHANKKQAIAEGYSVSSHDPIKPSPYGTPWRGREAS